MGPNLNPNELLSSPRAVTDHLGENRLLEAMLEDHLLLGQSEGLLGVGQEVARPLGGLEAARIGVAVAVLAAFIGERVVLRRQLPCTTKTGHHETGFFMEPDSTVHPWRVKGCSRLLTRKQEHAILRPDSLP
eukprot:2983110-Rhodomonas_salina.1